MAMSKEQDSILRAIDMLPEGVHKEVYKKAVTRLFNEQNGTGIHIDEQFIKELIQTMGQNGSKF
ncbi:hypothetical protein J2S09_000463 [Bacillus fengqiuensis]|nr:hypothetical protein [Bacillus fengqiuensis]